MYKDDEIVFKTGLLAGMTHKEIMDKARMDDENQSKIKDPFLEGEKKYGGSPKQFTKRMLKDLHQLLEK